MQELVQVESLAQVGVQLLLFTLGLEFSLQKLKAVRSVALIGSWLLLRALHIVQRKDGGSLQSYHSLFCVCLFVCFLPTEPHGYGQYGLQKLHDTAFHNTKSGSNLLYMGES